MKTMLSLSVKLQNNIQLTLLSVEKTQKVQKSMCSMFLLVL